MFIIFFFFFFFFQAEDGIRDGTVTGVQTCALPIFPVSPPASSESMSSVLKDMDDIIVPGLTHWNHPDFFAYFPNTDRKSTRLNSSHSSISYAVFCLKKKKKK